MTNSSDEERGIELGRRERKDAEAREHVSWKGFPERRGQPLSFLSPCTLSIRKIGAEVRKSRQRLPICAL